MITEKMEENKDIYLHAKDNFEALKLYIHNSNMEIQNICNSIHNDMKEQINNHTYQLKIISTTFHNENIQSIQNMYNDIIDYLARSTEKINTTLNNIKRYHNNDSIQ